MSDELHSKYSREINIDGHSRFFDGDIGFPSGLADPGGGHTNLMGFSTSGNLLPIDVTGFRFAPSRSSFCFFGVDVRNATPLQPVLSKKLFVQRGVPGRGRKKCASPPDWWKGFSASVQRIAGLTPTTNDDFCFPLNAWWWEGKVAAVIPV